MTVLEWRRIGLASWTEFPAWLTTTIAEMRGHLRRPAIKGGSCTAAKYRNRCGWERTMEDVPGR